MVNPYDSLLQKLVAVAQICYSVPEVAELWLQIIVSVKGAIHSQLNWAILLCDVIPEWKNWVNCAVLTGNSAGLRTVLSSRLSHTELRSSLRESHSLLSLPADTTMSHAKEDTHRTDKKKLTNLTGNLCCARKYSVQFFVQYFFYTVLDFITRTILGEEYKSFSSSLCNLLHSPVTSSILGPNILLKHP